MVLFMLSRLTRKKNQISNNPNNNNRILWMSPLTNLSFDDEFCSWFFGDFYLIFLIFVVFR